MKSHVETDPADLLVRTDASEEGGMCIREFFAVQILNGLVANLGTPDRFNSYRTELPREEDLADGTRQYMTERNKHLAELAALNRRAICRQAVLLADELIATLNETR